MQCAGLFVWDTCHIDIPEVHTSRVRHSGFGFMVYRLGFIGFRFRIGVEDSGIGLQVSDFGVWVLISEVHEPPPDRWTLGFRV